MKVAKITAELAADLIGENANPAINLTRYRMRTATG
jgi:hypothetical protein